METNRMVDVYKYADKLARFLYNEGFRVGFNGKPDKQLRAVINNYCKKENFVGVEREIIALRVSQVMHNEQTKLYR